MRTLLCLSLCAAAPLAQSGASGSESFASSARSAPATGGTAAGFLYLVESEVGRATAGPGSDSETYHFEGGAVWTGPDLAASGPVLFGVGHPHGVGAGGAVEVLFGAGFQSAGAGMTTVHFDGSPAGGVVVLSDTRVEVVTPPGVNLFGNPAAIVDVALANDLGAATASGAYAFTPALVQVEEAVVGTTFHLHAVDEPGALHVLAYGLSIPGLAIPIAPFGGALELVTVVATVGGLVPTATGYTSYPIPLPDSPSLIGKGLEWQLLSLSSLAPAAGSFSNRIVTTIGG